MRSRLVALLLVVLGTALTVLHAKPQSKSEENTEDAGADSMFAKFEKDAKKMQKSLMKNSDEKSKSGESQENQQTQNKTPFWNGLRTTWSMDPAAKFRFNATGRTVAEAEALGFEFLDDFCSENNTRFRGRRYWRSDDPSFALLFDVQGTVAGFQTMVPKSKYTPASRLVNRPLVDDGDYWTMTAYLVEPKEICKTGRNERKLQKQGTGDRLILQNCADAVNHHKNPNKEPKGALPAEPMVKVPMTEKALNHSNWVRGSCIKAMGFHYFYNISSDMSTDEYFRMQMLVFDGKLLGLAFIINAQPLLTPERYEKTPAAGSKKALLPSVLQLFDTDKTVQLLNTLHVYFIDDPVGQIVCPA